MPGFISHYLFGMKTYHALPDGCLKDIIKRHPSSYYLGLQGPDIYFYYLPSLIGDGSRNIGSLMHDSHIHDFFARFIREMELIRDGGSSKKASPYAGTYHLETALSYFAGFLCHYILDCCCHPYIYAKTDFRSDDPERLCYYARHRSFETLLDTLLLEQLKHQEPSRFHRAATMRNNRFETGCLALLLCRCINDVFHPDLSRSIYKKADMSRSKHYIDRLYYRETRRDLITPKTMRNIFFFINLECRILDDPTGRKKQWIQSLEQKTVQYDLLSSLMSDDLPKEQGAFNLAHEVWHSPWEPNKERRESFPQLFSASCRQSADTLLLLEQYGSGLMEELPYTSLAKGILLDRLGNRSYHSGLTKKEN